MNVNLNGQFEAAADPEAVYDFITDPDKFAPILPYFKGLTKTSETEFTVTLEVGVPQIRGKSDVQTKRIGAERPKFVKYQLSGRHELAGRPSISLDELAGHRIILPDIGFRVRQQLAEIQEQTGRRIPVVMTSNSIQTILDCVVANLGATVLSVTSVPEHLTKSDLVAVPIDDPLLQASRVQIIKRNGRRLPASALALIETLEHLLRNATP